MAITNCTLVHDAGVVGNVIAKEPQDILQGIYSLALAA